MLEHFRTQLGSQESENLALRQEIAALKKALLEGRGGPINLPPPAPLPAQSAAETLAASNPNISTTTPVQNSPLLMANTQKDLPTSPRMGGPRFWGGVGMGGSGSTPVHTTLVPDISTIVRNGLQENMNPALNAVHGPCGIRPNKALGLGGFDGFADLNPFTMKTLDAYVSFSLYRYLTEILVSKQLSYAPVGENGCSTANTPESNIAESPESFRIGLQFASSLLLCLAQAQPAALSRIWQYAICFTFWKAQHLLVLDILYAIGLFPASSERRRFTATTFTPSSLLFLVFLNYFYQSVVVSERTGAREYTATSCHVGCHG